MTAALAHAHAYVFCLQLLPLGGENLDNQCRDEETEPFDGNPPPTNKEPPEDAAVLGFQLCFSNHLHIHIRASAFWTSHVVSPSFKKMAIF